MTPKRRIFVHRDGVGACPVCSVEPQLFVEFSGKVGIDHVDAEIADVPGNRRCARCGLPSLVFDGNGNALSQALPLYTIREIEAARAYYREFGTLAEADPEALRAFLVNFVAEKFLREESEKPRIEILVRGLVRNAEGISPSFEALYPEKASSDEGSFIDAEDFEAGTLIVIVRPERRES